MFSISGGGASVRQPHPAYAPEHTLYAHAFKQDRPTLLERLADYYAEAVERDFVWAAFC